MTDSVMGTEVETELDSAFRRIGALTSAFIRTMAVERFESVVKTGVTFEYPEGFDGHWPER